MHHRLLTAVLAGCLMLSGVAAASTVPAYDRLYLAGADGEVLHWTVDPSDPELTVARARWDCPDRGVPGRRGCSTSASSRFYASFVAASVLHEPVEWSADDAPRFHLDLDVESPYPFPYTVELAFQQGLSFTESQPAKEVAPGVWEGAFSGAGSWDPGSGNRIYLFIRGERPRAEDLVVDLRLGGRSWIDLPVPVTGRSVPELIRRSPDTLAPKAYRTPARSFWFNDADWEVVSFSGDLTETRTFAHTLERPVAAVYGWIEANDAPFVHHAVRKREVDTRRLTDAAFVRLLRNDVEIAAGPAQNNQIGRGSNTLATVSLQPGDLALEVSQGRGTTTQDAPYQAYLLLLYGERTLQRMHWRFEPSIAEPFIPLRAVAGTCVNRSEPVATPQAVSTFLVDLDWDTVGVPTAKWTIAHGYPNAIASSCGELSTGDRLRTTVPGERVWTFSPTPAPRSVFASYRDTVFEFDVRFSYAPA